METTRCERCGYDNPGETSACAQCGATLVTAATIARTEAATPVWQRAQAPKPVEAPPWSGSENAAPWQTPPEFGKPGRPRAAKTAEQAESAEAESERVEAITADPPPPPRLRLPARAVTVTVLLQLGALSLLVYAVYAVVARRGIFLEISSAPGSVPLVTAQGSDTTNLTMFLIAGLLAVAAAGCFGWWVMRGLRVQQFEGVRPGADPDDERDDGEPLGLASAALLGLGWIVAAGAGVLAVLVAFALHLGGDAGTIATGYIVLGAGSILIAMAMIRAGWLVYRTEKSGLSGPMALLPR